MGGGPSQQTNSVQSTNQNFNDLSSMIQNMATQGLTNYQNQQNVNSNTNTNQNTVSTNNQNTTGTNFSNSAGTSTGAQTGASAFQNNPWAPAIPQLNNILSAIGGQGMSMTPAQQAALGATSAAAGTMPNFGPSASGAVGNLFGSVNGIPQAGMWGNAFNNFSQSMSPFTNVNNLNPYNTPGVQEWLNGPGGLNEQIGSNLKSMYAASGRDPTGAGNFGKSYADAITAADAPILAGQYNQNVTDYLGAQNNILGGAERMATGTTGLIQTPLQNEIAGINNAPNAGQLWMGPSMAQLGAANTAFGLPYSNIAIPAGMVQQIAGLGQQGTGTTAGTQTGTQTGAQTGGSTSSTQGSSTSNVTGSQQQVGSTTGSGSQQQQKVASGSTAGTQAGTQQGTSVGNSTTTSSQNPFATAAGVGLGLFSMFG